MFRDWERERLTKQTNKEMAGLHTAFAGLQAGSEVESVSATGALNSALHSINIGMTVQRYKITIVN